MVVVARRHRRETLQRNAVYDGPEGSGDAVSLVAIRGLEPSVTLRNLHLPKEKPKMNGWNPKSWRFGSDDFSFLLVNQS